MHTDNMVYILFAISNSRAFYLLSPRFEPGSPRPRSKSDDLDRSAMGPAQMLIIPLYFKNRTLKKLNKPRQTIPGLDSQLSINDCLSDTIYFLGLPDHLILFFILLACLQKQWDLLLTLGSLQMIDSLLLRFETSNQLTFLVLQLFNLNNNNKV